MDSRPSVSLQDLQAPDELGLVFNPIGFGGEMKPEDAVEHQARTIAAAVLADTVPETVRENFGRARKLHLYGVLEYEFFTAAPEYALLVLEAALRVRFITYYDHEIPVFHGDTAATLAAPDFDAVREARKTKLRRAEGSKAELPTYLKALLGWARQERLLPGRRSRIVDNALVELRNHSAHPTGRTVDAPPDSSRMLCTVAEYINRLWGAQTPGGRHFPGPLARRPRVAGLAAGGSGASQMELSQVNEIADEECDWTYAVFLAAEEEELVLPRGGICFAYEHGFQATLFPCERLWEGSWNKLVTEIEAGAFAECADTVQHLDRLFFICAAGEGIELARGAADMLALENVPDGRWYAITADAPHDAFTHVRDHEGEGRREAGTCPQCFVEVEERFESGSDALAWARRYQSDELSGGSQAKRR